ncbi:hypothetical protein [Paenibacillus sp. PAMC21692]|uniref:hypothetical protein n=1 Tax=Paenibacillus sp. PAMC21692 TaxID=2762320 RepID=UPI00164D1ED9|nr:hypothetical protein [Paenibacillus sp. PAMC21692]QNK55159.1 hypothetical protein H7F31_21340 [Paenibacillus sp. PAMC21692]
MESEELIKQIKSDLYKEVDDLKRDHLSFKKRISIISNLLIPGVGFLIYGGSYLKGFISFLLFISYNILFFTKIENNVDTSMAVIYYIPAIAIWIVSAAMVAGLDD